MVSSLLYNSSMSSCFSPNTEQKYLLNVAGVCASSLVLKRFQPLQDLLSCQNFFWPHDAATISSSTAGPSCQEAPFITFRLNDVLLVAPSPLHHNYGFLPFPFITQREDGLWPNRLPDQGHPVEFNPKKVCRDHSRYPAPMVGCRGRAPLGVLHPTVSRWAAEATPSNDMCWDTAWVGLSTAL